MHSVIQKESFNSVRVFWLNERLLRERLKEAAGKLAASFDEVSEIILFGSLVTGAATATSDADIMIVVDDSDTRFLDRAFRFRRHFEGIGVSVDIFVYTRSELEGGAIPFAADAFQRGEPLYRRPTPE